VHRSAYRTHLATTIEFVSDRCPQYIGCIGNGFLCTCGIVDERAVDVQLNLAFFAMFWQLPPVFYAGEVRARLDAQHQWPYNFMSSQHCDRWQISSHLLARTDYAAYLIVDESSR
jgi:hypothetical protein